jgi:hypothetical protein
MLRRFYEVRYNHSCTAWAGGLRGLIGLPGLNEYEFSKFANDVASQRRCFVQEFDMGASYLVISTWTQRGLCDPEGTNLVAGIPAMHDHKKCGWCW